MEPRQLLLYQVRVDLGVMGMKGYPTLPWTPELGPHHQIQFSVISRIFNVCVDFIHHYMLHEAVSSDKYVFLKLKK